MLDKIFIEENSFFKIDCKKADEIFELHDEYHKNILSDVDLIIVDKSGITFMEYKNSAIPNAANPKALEESIKEESHYIKIARKYYDSLIYICHKADCSMKERKYYYVLECAKADSVVRKLLAGKIKKKLPFDLQENLENLSQVLIDHFEVLSICEWNNKFPDYQFEEYVTNP
jgi:hypothetical protein